MRESSESLLSLAEVDNPPNTMALTAIHIPCPKQTTLQQRGDLEINRKAKKKSYIISVDADYCWRS